MRKICENRRSLPYDRFEETFLKSVVEVELPGSTADDGPAKDRLALAEHKRATLQTKIDNFVAMIAAGTVSAALGQALQKAEAEAAELDIEVGAARDHLLEIQSTPAPNSRMAALREFVDQMNDPAADKLVVRSRLASAIASVVDDIHMDSDGVMTVIIMDGLRNYQIDGDRVIRSDAPDYAPDRVFNRGDGERAATVRRLRAA